MKRRDFIQYTGSSLLLPFLLDGFGAKAHTQATTPFMQEMLKVADVNERILVVIQLAGGNDGLNMVLPLDQYSTYTASNFRGSIAIPEAKVLSLNGYQATGLHPSMKGLQTLFNEGKLSIIQAAGYDNPSFSHFRASDIWFTATNANQFSTSGWLGRYIEGKYPNFVDDYPNTANPDPLAVQIASISSTVFNTSSVSSALAIQDPDTFYKIIGDKPSVIPGSLPNTPAGKYTAFVRQKQISSVAYASSLKIAAEKGKNLISYPTSNTLADQLKIVARMIHGGLQTKIYFVSLGGFDTHASQVVASDTTTGTHATLMGRLSDGIKAFMDDLKAQGTQDKVAGMTFSEFGRRAAANGSYGTDHGWASPLLIFGNGVKQQMIGKNPDLKALQSGNITMQNDFRKVYAAVLQDWMGASESSVKNVLLGVDPAPLPIFRAPAILANEEEIGHYELNIYPNPAQSETFLDSEAFAKNMELVVTDVYGRSFYTHPERLSRTKIRLNVDNMPMGKYFVKVETDKEPIVKALMVQR